MELRKALLEQTVKDVGYRDLVAVEVDASILDVIRVMQREAVGCVVVLHHTHLAGIFTERDLLVRVLAGEASLGERVDAHMTPDPQCARRDEPIHRVLARMREGGFRHLPVLNAAGTPVGTISVKRAVHFIAQHAPEAVLNLPPDPDGYPDTREGG